MGRIFSFSFSEVAITAQQDLFQIEAKVVPAILHAVFLSQSSEIADAEAGAVSILIRRVTDAVTNDVAEVKLDGGSAAANANLAINETTELVAGAEIIHAEAWNLQLPFVYLPPPELRPIIQVDNALVVNLNTTDVFTGSGTLYFEEFGN